MLPVTIRHTNEKTVEELADELQNISQMVTQTDTETVLSKSDGPLSRKVIAEGTFTFSNLCSVCKVSFQPLLIDIITPQTIAIALGSIQEKTGICIDAEGHKSIGSLIKMDSVIICLLICPKKKHSLRTNFTKI